MKISRITCENFRNFKEACTIDFPTDGRVTVIYGPNGVGKTTLHQLFQWIIYGEVHFNKTASAKMYNLQLEQETPVGSRFAVKGSIDFEHPNAEGVVEKYRLQRNWYYKKGVVESKREDYSEFGLTKLIGDDWKPVREDPDTIIERILPSGLSRYFFFDGENMIADLNLKGRDSAKALRRALYAIFDLDIYEQALTHIGEKTKGTSTVLGNLYLSMADTSTNADVIKAGLDVKLTTKKIEETKEEIKRAQSEVDRYRGEIQRLSEIIGGAQSSEILEKRRKRAKETIKSFEEAISKEQLNFGASIMSCYPNLLIARIVEEAQYRISLKVENEQLLPGLKKELIESLLGESTCLCGHHIGDAEREVLTGYIRLFPPLSYKSVYDQFKNAALRWGGEHNPKLLFDHIVSVLHYKHEIEQQQQEITDIDNDLKQNANLDELIAKRAKAETSIAFWEKKIKELSQKQGLQDQYLKQYTRKYDEVRNKYNTNRDVTDKIEIMEMVAEYFRITLENTAISYSQKLCAAIQDLLDKMLTSIRKVFVTPQFEISVRDSFGDEAKSEGQFAVVSFAYIGGIFKLLSETDALKSKEYPLILDGPFSKLDAQQRQNVVDTIPSYAPQVILFSKDDLNECFHHDTEDCVWTIYSNDERNVSFIKKGYDPEVFTSNAIDN